MFEIHQSPKNKEFYFRLKAGNRQVILSSEGYKTKASCQGGIAAVRKNGISESAFELKTAKDGRVYFTLGAKNGEVIGSSQMYKSARSRNKGIASVIRNAASTVTKDLTE